MKRLLALLVAMGVVALASPQEADAQFYRGGSGFAISIGNGVGGFGPGFGGFGPGWGGFGPAYGFRPAGVNFGYSSFRPVYGYNRSFHSGYRGGYGRSCRGW